MPFSSASPAYDTLAVSQPAVHTLPAPAKRRLILAVLSLALVAVLLVQGIQKGEFSENVDETVHAATGLYVASFLHDLPLRHPVQYTYRYYAQYPSLGIVMYPPAFYIMEGIAFSVFGPSVVVARLTVLALALFGLYCWFSLISELEDEYTAALSTVLLAFLPAIVRYEKTVMLDIPLLAFCLAASKYWILYLRRGSPKLLYWFAVFLCLACLTKQHAMYLFLFCLITLAMEKKWDRLLNWRAAGVAAACFVVVAPVYFMQIAMNSSLFNNLAGNAATANTHWYYYWSQLPELIGWGALVLSVAGMGMSLWQGKRENAMVMLAWIASCYVMFSLFRHKEARYILYWCPAFAYFAVAPFTRKTSAPWIRVAGFAVVLLVVTVYGVRAWKYQRFYVSGYSQLAQRLTQRKGGCVLVDMNLPGNFTFFMRAFDPARRFVILRKALYDVRTYREWGFDEFAHDQRDVENVLTSDSVAYVVVEQNMPLHFSSQTALRELLDRSGQYKPVATIPIESNMSDWQGKSLVLYESTASVVPPHGILHIKMAHLRHDIDIPLEQLAGPGADPGRMDKHQ